VLYTLKGINNGYKSKRFYVIMQVEVRKEQRFSALVGCFLPARLMPTITAKVHKIPENIHVLLSIGTTTGTSYMTYIVYSRNPPPPQKKDGHLALASVLDPDP
jgi:hypothetical protein